jgi:hypothetical protein
VTGPNRTGRPLTLGLLGAGVVLAPWAVLLITVPLASQDFPLIDDWAYARGAYAFNHGALDYQHWASMPLLGQWLWSVPFLRALGASHLALRASTIVLSWLGLAAFFSLLRRTGATPGVALFTTACLAWNPYFFLLSGTYMTDVPALAFALLALAGYVRALDGGRLLPLAGATLAALAAVATRQNAVAAPLAAGVLLLRSPYRARPLWLAIVAVPVAAAVALHFWLGTRPDVVPLHARFPDPGHVAWVAFTSACYLGLLAVPLLVLRPGGRPGAVFWGTLAVLAVAAAGLAVARPLENDGVFPYLGDLLTARGTYLTLEGAGQPSAASWAVRLVLTALGCVGGAALLDRAATRGKALWGGPLLVFSLLQLAALAVAPKYYDRYLLMLVPGALAVAAAAASRPRWLAGGAALVLLGAVTVCLMHDWFSWNAARWDLGRRAAALGIAPDDIQGGMEWDHWYPRDRAAHYRLTLARPRRGAPVEVERFALWLPPRQAAVYLVRLDAAPGPPQETP